MKSALVYDGVDVHIPEKMGTPRRDQMHGAPAEQLIELCGRVCYDSVGTGRSSLDYHKHLYEAKHFSVYEHVHFTLETTLPAAVWVGIPDVVAIVTPTGRVRLTANLRHCLEWPNNVTFRMEGDPVGTQNVIDDWASILAVVKHTLCPNIFPDRPRNYPPSEFTVPKHPEECFVSLWLEDSRVWSHEMVRHRHNMSQRSGRFVDEADRDYCLHPHLQEFLNECGYLSLNQEDGEKLWCEAKIDDPAEINRRTRLGNLIGSHITQSKMLYDGVVTHLQPWLEMKGMDRSTARKQARSAARYYLGNGLSTEMIYTASIAAWQDIFTKRCQKGADAAIHHLMEQARMLVRGSRWGHLLEP